MNSSKQIRVVGWEVVKWLAIITLAMLLASVLINHTNGGPTKGLVSHGLLPPSMQQKARPIDRELQNLDLVIAG